MPRIAHSQTCLCCDRHFGHLHRADGNPEICEACYDEAGYENAHSDGNHDATPDAGCHICSDTDPHAGNRTRTVSGNQGKVLRDTDGRKKENAPAVPADAARVTLLGPIRGRGNKYAGLQGAVIATATQCWDGHKGDWLQVQVDGVTQCRWFWKEETAPVQATRAPRARRSRAAAAA